MLTLSGLLTEYKAWTKDSTTENSTNGTTRMNMIYRTICAGKNYYWLEKEYTDVTVADQQSYNLPIDNRKVVSVRVTVGGDDYILDEIPSPQKFDEINRDGSDETSDYPTYYHERNGKIYIYPIPATADYTITILYLRRPIDLEQTDYTTGTITATNGDETIVGSGTDFTTLSISTNTKLIVGGVAYDIDSVTDGTNLELTEPFQGTTTAGLSYIIGDVPIIPEDFHDILWLGAAKYYYGLSEEDTRTFQMTDAMFNELEARLVQATRSRGVSNVHNKGKVMRYRNEFPYNLNQ